MPMQQQQGSLASKMGGLLSAANEACMDAPINVGFQRLPPGIRNGVAKLVEIEWVDEEEDNKPTPKGMMKCRLVAVVVYPYEFAGEKTADRQIYKTIPLCNIPAKTYTKDGYDKEAVSFNANFAEFKNYMAWWGVSPCRETTRTDPTGDKTEMYWRGAMAMLVDPQRPPTYIQFTTEEFTPKATPNKTKPDKIFVEKWKGLANEKELALVNGQYNPAAGMMQTNSQPHHTDAPPSVGADGLPLLPPGKSNQEPVYEVEVGSKWKFVRRGGNGEKVVDSKGVETSPIEVEVTWTDGSNCHVKRLTDGKDLVDFRTKKPIIVKCEWLE